MTEPTRLLPEHVTMPLLLRVTQQALDQDYVEAAELRGDQPQRPAGQRVGVWGVLAVVASFGLLISTAAVQESRNAEVQKTSIFGTSVHVVLSTAEVTAATVISWIRQAGLEVADASAVEPSLEDVFLDVVEGVNLPRGTP